MMEEEIQFRHILPIQLRFSDVDRLGHLNNSVYFSLYDLAKNTYFNEVLGVDADRSKPGVVIANIQANFIAPIYLEENIAIQTATVRLGNKSFTLAQRAVDVDTNEVKCVCHTVMVGYDLETKQSEFIPEDYKKAILAFEGRAI